MIVFRVALIMKLSSSCCFLVTLALLLLTSSAVDNVGTCGQTGRPAAAEEDATPGNVTADVDVTGELTRDAAALSVLTVTTTSAPVSLSVTIATTTNAQEASIDLGSRDTSK